MNPYYEDEWYEDECDYCGSHYDADGWCPFCDYEHFYTDEAAEGEDDAETEEQWYARRSVELFGPDGYDEDGTPYVELQ